MLYSATDCDLSNKNISKILSKNRISICEKVKDAFISSTFTKEEKDALYRITLNLKQLHKFVPYEHFKMESLTIVVNIIEQKYWMQNENLRDAFYSIPIHFEERKYLEFLWNHKFFCFKCVPSG